MALRYPPEWKFDNFGVSIPNKAHLEFLGLVKRIVAGEPDPKLIYEILKSAYGETSGSSDVRWSEADLIAAMSVAKDNAAIYVDSFWGGLIELKLCDVPIPSADCINAILEKWEVPLIIAPPYLRMKGEGDVTLSDSPIDDASLRSPVYQREEEIGRGGFGVVYRVTRKTTAGEFEYAMKVFDPSVFNKNKERALQRFNREAKALNKLHHRGIILHIEAGVTSDDEPYILMPLIKGCTLDKALSGKSPLSIFSVFKEILMAVAYAHSQKVVHRDLKPSNVMVRSSDSQAIILDFGCAYLIDEVSGDSLTTTLIGSSAYMPNEVLRNPKHRNTKQDVFACGVMLHEILVGTLPNLESYKSIENELESCKGIDKLIKDAIAPEESRIATAIEFYERLRALTTQSHPQ